MESVYDAIVKEFSEAHDLTASAPTLARVNFRHSGTLLRWYADVEVGGGLQYRTYEVLDADVDGRQLGWIHAAPRARGFAKYRLRRAVESLRNAPRGTRKTRHA